MGEAGDAIAVRRGFDWRTAGYLIVWAIALLFLWKMARVTWAHAQANAGIDFYFFWDAATRVLRGDPAAVYLPHASAAGMLEPLGHPPPFLLLTAPLGIAGYGAALVAWLALTGVAYAVSAKQPLRVALANPAAAYNVLFGQTGFLTSALLVGGGRLLRSRPWVGGALLGLLVIKPQFALLVPFALLGGRNWRALGAASASAVLLTAAAALAFGPGIYGAWWNSLAGYGGWLEGGHWGWTMLASPYGLLRWSGLGNALALGAQLAIGIAAAALVFHSWRRGWESRVAVLAAATLLASPYSFAYDAVPMIAPLGLLARGQRWRAALVWGLMLVPLLATSFVSGAYLPFETTNLPNTIPLAAAASLFFLCKDRKRNSSRDGDSIGT